MKVDTVVIVGVVALIAIAVYLLDPTFFGLLGKRYDGFNDGSDAELNPIPGATTNGLDNPMARPDSGASDTMKDLGGNEHVELSEEQKKLMAAGGVMSPFMNGGSASASEGFESGPADFGNATAPAGCYPRDQLTATELLPKDANSVWAQQNPMGPGSLKGKNFLSAGALVGINTVGQSMKNANLQLRSEPPNPQVPISIFNNSTIEPDFNRRPLEIN